MKEKGSTSSTLSSDKLLNLLQELIQSIDSLTLGLLKNLQQSYLLLHTGKPCIIMFAVRFCWYKFKALEEL